MIRVNTFLLIALALLLVITSLVRAEELDPRIGEADRLMNTAKEAYGRADYDAALSNWERASALYKAALGPRHPYVAETYNNMAVIYMSQGDYAKALTYYDIALEIRLATLGAHHPDIAQTYNNMAIVYSNQGDYAKALEYYRKDLDITLVVLGPRHPDVAQTYNNMANVYCNQADYASALEYFGKALEIRLAVLNPSHPDVAQTYVNMANTYNDQGGYAKALDYYRKALDIGLAALGPDHPNVATTYNNMAAVYDELGDYAKALEYCGKAIKIKLVVLGPRHPEVATTYCSMANVYGEQGDYAKALIYYEKALDIDLAALGPRHPEVAGTYLGIANVYAKQGDAAAALDYYGRALKIRLATFGPHHPEVATTYNNIANIYADRRDYTMALAYYRKALEIRLAALDPRHPDVAQTYNNIALVYDAQGDYTKALEYYEKDLEITLVALGSRHPDVAMTYNNMALATCSEGDTPAGIRLFQQSLDAVATDAGAWDGSGQTLRPLPDVPQWLFSLSKAEASDTSRPARIRLSSALKTAKVGLDVLSRLRAMLSKESRQFFEERNSNLPGWVLYLQYELKKLGEPLDKAATLHASEMASSVSFMEMMADARVGAAGVLSDACATEEHNLLAHIKWLDDHANDMRLLPERAAIENTWATFLDRLYREYPRYAVLKYPRPATLEQTQRILTPDEATLEYVVSKYGCFLVAMTRDSFVFTKVSDKYKVNDLIVSMRRDIAEQIQGSQNLPAKMRQNKLDTTLEDLYRILLNPVESLINGKRLIIVPSGILEAVSFESLKRADGRYLVEANEVSYAPSLAILALEREWKASDPARSRRLLALGRPNYGEMDAEAGRRARSYSDTMLAGWNDLPGTETEVKNIARLFPAAERRVLLQSEATEKNVIAEDWQKFGYLHFACHGALEDGPGRQPALVFSLTGNTPPNDGFLTLSEVVSRPHRARMTVLSACNTGRSGQTLQRTGVSSLARAFLLTGSDAVIVSLWSVSDIATAKLMTLLYQGMREDNLSPGAALRKAQAVLRTNPTFAHPAYWAPFICVGE